MKLETYQPLAVRTAVDTARNLDYLVPMIVGEVGELFGKRAKAVRDGWTQEDLNVHLVSEYGDVAWGTAVLLKISDVHYEHQTESGYSTTSAVDPWQRLLDISNNLYFYYSTTPNLNLVGKEASQIWQELGKLSEAITGRPFGDVLQYNVDKLQNRAARGTLQGSGDNR